MNYSLPSESLDVGEIEVNIPLLRLCTKNTSRALIERPYSCAPQAVGAVYDRPGFFVQSPALTQSLELFEVVDAVRNELAVDLYPNVEAHLIALGQRDKDRDLRP